MNSKYHIYPLSFGEERIWFLHQLTPNLAVYNIPFNIRITGITDTEEVKSCISLLIQRHEILRTKFLIKDTKPIQVVYPEGSCDFSELDLTNASPKHVESIIMQRAANDLKKCFDLVAGPLLRADLIRLPQQQLLINFTIHHIITDGWSIDIFKREFNEIYQSRRSATPAVLPPPTIQYGDYAIWQRKSITSSTVKEQLNFWIQKLKDSAPLLELPSDRHRCKTQTFAGAIQSLILSKSKSMALKNLCVCHKVSAFMLILTIFKILLYKYTSQIDLLVGTPVANRSRPETQSCLGFFVNSLVVRTTVQPEATFLEYLQIVRSETLLAYANQEAPFEKIVAEIVSDRQICHSPLFQVMFAHQAGIENTFHKVSQEALYEKSIYTDPQPGTSKFDLTLFSEEIDHCLVFTLEYNTHLYNDSRKKNFLTHLENLIDAIIQNPDLRIREYSILSKKEYIQLSNEFSGQIRDYPKNETIHDIFSRTVMQLKKSVAIIEGNHQCSYEELEDDSNRISAYISSRYPPNSIIGVLMDRSILTTKLLLGILKAGCIYLPFDMRSPKQRLERMIKQAQPSLIFIEPEAIDLPREMKEINRTAFFIFNNILSIPWSNANIHPQRKVSSDSPAYIMFTSGSTGDPKAVMVGHQSVIRLLFDQDYYHADDKDCFLQFAPISFDASTFEIWGCLLNGARLAIAPRGITGLGKLAEFIQENNVTICWLTSSLLNEMVVQNSKISCLKYLLTGGEVLSASHIKKALLLLDGCRILNCYGPTENTTFTTFYEIREVIDDVPISIGKPLKNTFIYLLDQWLTPVPVGVPGKLYIAGDGLAIGYPFDDELTTRKFIFINIRGKQVRCYDSGDMARFDQEGNIEFLGRQDKQIKLRGFRMEAGEIENTFCSYPEVKHALVYLEYSDSGEKHLVAVIVPNSPSVDRIMLRAYLAERLPDYMIPSVMYFTDVLPVNINGKVERPAKIKEYSSAQASAGTQQLLTQLEKNIHDLWCELLDTDSAGIDENFFEIGGHSLLITRMHLRIREQGFSITLVDLFQYPSIRSLSTFLQAQQVLFNENSDDLTTTQQMATRSFA